MEKSKCCEECYGSISGIQWWCNDTSCPCHKPSVECKHNRIENNMMPDTCRDCGKILEPSVTESEEPHNTVDSWCCACDYDIVRLNDIIAIKSQKLKEETEKIARISYLSMLDQKIMECKAEIKEKIDNLTYYHNDIGVTEIDWGVDYVRVEDLKNIINKS